MGFDLKLISVHNVKEGMVIAEDIYSKLGELLIEEGKILNSSTIAILIRSKIEMVKVYTSEDNDKINIVKLLRKYNVSNVEELHKLISDKLNNRFARSVESELMRDILNKTIDYELKSLGIGNKI